VLAAYGIAGVDALAFGVSLQALELGVAAALGGPALMREGVGWRDMRRRALEAASLDLPAPPSAPPRAHAQGA
jgi:phosphatidylinositol alpha-mannosyltransferase